MCQVVHFIQASLNIARIGKAFWVINDIWAIPKRRDSAAEYGTFLSQFLKIFKKKSKSI